MITALNITMIMLLLWIFYEDIKSRKVTLLLMLLLMGIGSFLNYKMQILELFFLGIAINMLVVLLVISLLWLYARFRFQKKLFTLFGMGDALFFVFLAVSFPVTTFLVVFSCSLIFSLFISVLFKKKLTKWVPLAGLQALFLSILIGVNHIFGIVNLYSF